MKYLNMKPNCVYAVEDAQTDHNADKIYNPPHLYSFIRAFVWREHRIKVGDRLVKAEKFSQSDALEVFGITPSAETIDQHFHDINEWR